MIPAIVLLLTLNLLNVKAFTTTSILSNKIIYSVKQPYVLPQSRLLGKEVEDEELKVEVEQALKQAEDAIKSAKVESEAPKPPPAKPAPAKPAPPKAKAGPLISKDQLQKLTDGSASAVGGIILGTALGIGVDIYLSSDYSYNFQLLSTEATLPPTILATLIGSLAFVASSQDNALGSITNNVLGGPAKALGKGINNSIQNVIQGVILYITSIPKKIQQSIQNKIDNTIAEVKQIPSKTAQAAKNVADDIVSEVKAAPKKVADSTKKAIVDTIENTEKQITKTVEETKEKVVKSVEETVALPAKKIKELNEKVGSLLDGGSDEKAITPKPPVDIPQPPLKPPVIQDQVISPPKIATPPPKDEAKSFVPPVPKIPDISLPEISIPKISIPEISIPELPKQEETPPKVQDKPKPVETKKEDDSFIFSEVALKEIFQKPSIEDVSVDDDKAKRIADQEKKAEEEALKKKRAEQEALKKKEEEIARKKAEQEVAKKKAEQDELAAKKKADQQKQLKLEAAKAKKEAARAKAEKMEELRLQKEQQQAEALQRQQELARQKQTLQKIEDKKGTISLGSIFGTAPPTTSDTVAPKGMPILSKWKLNNDMSISGIITNSPNFPDSDSVTTSSIKNDKDEIGDGGIVVTTISGTKYFLQKQQSSPSFSFFGSQTTPTTQTVNKALSEAAEAKKKQAQEAAEARKKEAEAALAEKQRLAEEARAQAEQKRLEAQAAAEARRKEAEERKRQLEEERTAALAEKQRLAEEAKALAEQKRLEAQAAAEQKRKEAEERKKQLEEERAAELAEKQRLAEEAKDKAEQKRQEAQAVAEARRKEAEERKKQLEEERAAALAEKQRLAEEAKAKAQAAAEAKRIEAEKNRAMLEEQRRQQAEKKAQAAEKKRKEMEITKAISSSPPRSTISLFGLFNKPDDDSTPKQTKPVIQPSPSKSISTKATAPKGIPTIYKWRQNNDGSISGFITGSKSFEDGEAVTTSAIRSGDNVSDGNVVQTGSGSKYFLTDKSSGALPSFFNFGVSASETSKPATTQKPKTDKAASDKEMQEKRAAASAALAEKRRLAEEAKAKAQAAAEARRKEAEEKKAAALAEKQRLAEEAKATAAQKRMEAQTAAEKRRKEAEEQKKKLEEKRQAAAAKVKEAEKVIVSSSSSSKPSKTISLFGFGNVQEQSTPDVVVKQPPRGVPIIKSWKSNKDGSLSGFISGSPSYDDGEFVTTSKIKSNSDVVGGSIVQTVSGSRYYLDPKTKSGGGGGLFSKSNPSTSVKTPAKKQPVKASPPSPSKSVLPFSRTTSIFSTQNIEAKQIPQNLPRFVNWKKNRDNSITGFISNSPSFPEGDRVSTSPITVGEIKAGEVVQTSSGSKYYLV